MHYILFPTSYGNRNLTLHRNVSNFLLRQKNMQFVFAAFTPPIAPIFPYVICSYCQSPAHRPILAFQLIGRIVDVYIDSCLVRISVFGSFVLVTFFLQMTHLFKSEKVQYLCTCGSLKPLCRTFFCRHCLALKCGDCVFHEVHLVKKHN